MGVGVIAGVLGLWLWYGPAFARYSVWQWPFVPDCPLFSLLFVPALALTLVKRPAPRYNAWVAFGLIKYGIWTVFVWVLYWVNSGGHFTVESVAMSLSHLGMILEGFLLLSFARTQPIQGVKGATEMDWLTVTLCVAWYGLSDWMDYGVFQTYPRFDTSLVSYGLVQWHTISVTILLSALYVYWAWRWAQVPWQIQFCCVDHSRSAKERQSEAA
jgi:uncharacterized membrane protein YpjA